MRSMLEDRGERIGIAFATLTLIATLALLILQAPGA